MSKPLSKNQKWEAKEKEKGLVKKTFWIPANCEIEFTEMVEFCKENRNYVPSLCRNLKTGRLAKC
jgi:hypothetical protein